MVLYFLLGTHIYYLLEEQENKGIFYITRLAEFGTQIAMKDIHFYYILWYKLIFHKGNIAFPETEIHTTVIHNWHRKEMLRCYIEPE